MTRQRLTTIAMCEIALLIRVTFATLAARQLFGDDHIALVVIGAIAITVATGAAVRVNRALT